MAEYICQHKKSAIKLFEIDMKKKHVNYKAIQCGMFINKNTALSFMQHLSFYRHVIAVELDVRK